MLIFLPLAIFPMQQSLNFSVNVHHFPYMDQDTTPIHTVHVPPSAEATSKAHEPPNHVADLSMGSRRGSDIPSERNSFNNTHILALAGAPTIRTASANPRNEPAPAAPGVLFAVESHHCPRLGVVTEVWAFQTQASCVIFFIAY